MELIPVAPVSTKAGSRYDSHLRIFNKHNMVTYLGVYAPKCIRVSGHQ